MHQKKPITQQREKAGLTQAELAQLVGVSENTIANWEKGTAAKWIHQLHKLCLVLNCSLEDLDSDLHPPIDSCPELTSDMLNAVKNYCVSVSKNDKRSATKIASFATLYDKQLRYWLDQAGQLIIQSQRSGEDQPDCEFVINTIILKHLINQLSCSPPNEIQYHKFCELVQKVQLSREFLDRYITFEDKDYTRKLILQTWSLTVYVIGWRPGQEVLMHHHGNALDAIQVIEGEMTHWSLSEEECEKAKIPFEGCPAAKRYDGPADGTYSAGKFVFINRRYAHQIANLSKHQHLVTLHFRFGAPPDDDKWSTKKDEFMFVWNQTNQCQMRKP